jgi:predicted peptidase
MLKLISVLGVLATLIQPTGPGLYRMVFAVPDLGPMRYGVSLPRGYNPREARPLVLALHPGGERMEYYGAAFVQQVVAPGLSDLGAIIVAPDCPTRSWTDPIAERAVMALVRSVLNEYSIDRSRVVVTGFSMGGRGTWFMASRHPDLFTAAISIAGAPGDAPLERLAKTPIYVIHSKDDEVVPFASTERAVADLKRLGRIVEFEALEDVTHFQMGGYVDALERGGRWIAERWK